MDSKETDNPKATEKDPVFAREEYLTKALKSKGFTSVSWVEETGSTNDDLLEKISGIDTGGRVLIADFQTSGKGRFDRKWVAEINSALLMSVSFLADVERVNLGVFASGIAVASCTALRSLGFEQVRIKWPNDIVVENSSVGGQAKLAGVLAQSKLVRTRASVVVGIGINVHPSNIQDVITQRGVISLSDLGSPPDRVHLAEAILLNLGDLDFQSPDLWESYRRLSATIGQDVRVTTGTGVLEGKAKDITEFGSLLLEDNGGVVREVISGDLVSLRPL